MVNEMADIQSIKNIGIIGRGAIGVNIAFNLQLAVNIKTTLLVRDNNDLNQQLTLLDADGNTHQINTPQQFLSQHALKQLDILVIPVKQYQIEALLQELAPILSSQTAILLLHNGMGGIELAQKYLPNNPLLVATTTDGVYKSSPTCFSQTAVGQFDIGIVDEEDPSNDGEHSDWEYLGSLHPNLRWRNDIVFALYQKIAVNAAINPLTALKNCKNGELLNYHDDIKKIKEEIFDLYEFMNLPLDNHALSQHIDAVILLTKDNYSSMHQDFHNGRETEVEGILGFLLDKAKETGMKMPLIQTLYEQIKVGSK